STIAGRRTSTRPAAARDIAHRPCPAARSDRHGTGPRQGADGAPAPLSSNFFTTQGSRRTPIPETLGAGAARQARVLARLSRAPERNVRGYLSTGAQRKRSQNPRSAGVLVRQDTGGGRTTGQLGEGGVGTAGIEARVRTGS